MTFEWDDHKRQLNLNKHALDFPVATLLFDGRPVLHSPVLYPHEDRFITLGELEGRVVAVVWTWRGSSIRIISARRARQSERRLFQKALTY